MEFHVTEQAARGRRQQIERAGEALGLRPGFVDTDFYQPGSRDDLARYLADHGIEFFSVDEVVTPHHADKAREAGFGELIPPLHLWPWTLLALAMGDEMRRAVGRAVRLRNLYRPLSYNRLVATSGVQSDHPNACAGDFDFSSTEDRRTAEEVVRRRAMSDPVLELSMGMGGRSLHVGVMSPKGPRSWFYDSYNDPHRLLAHGELSAPVVDPVDPGPLSPFDTDPLDDFQGFDDEPEAPPVLPTPVPDMETPLPFDDAMKIHIINQTAVHESGGDFGAVNRDGEFEGRFDRPGARHPASGHFHIGLSYGIVQFTQDSGTLGKLLEEMRRREPSTFADVFGPMSDALVDLTTRKGATSQRTPPRGVRVHPLDGADLWEDQWVSRFRDAAEHEPFQSAQLLMAARLYLDPMVQFASWLGLNTDRALGMVFDRSVQMGRGGSRRWIMEQVGPVTDTGTLRLVLTGYGFSGLRQFQRQIDGLEADGAFGPLSHAALCHFEKQRDDSDPFVMHVPDRETMLDMLVEGAADRRWHRRVERLRTSDEFTDSVLDI